MNLQEIAPPAALNARIQSVVKLKATFDCSGVITAPVSAGRRDPSQWTSRLK